MEILRGKQVAFMNTVEFAEQRAGYDSLLIDLGTGDGRFVRHIAQTDTNCLVIGLDACRENLHETARRAPANTLFVIANAQTLPPELNGLAARITINFPWGSLLQGLLIEETGLLTGLFRLAQPNAALTLCLNGGALREADWELEAGTHRIREVLMDNGFKVQLPYTMSAHDLRSYPTTWAKRLVFGRDPRAVCLRAIRTARA
jgi:16S rRNA (adenine(1408)-N(1))-methyltransferase